MHRGSNLLVEHDSLLGASDPEQTGSVRIGRDRTALLLNAELHFD
jgi:hypothetical protein